MKIENSKLKVSVIICTLDRKDELCSTLKCVLKQSYRPYEIIVVDGSSNDDTMRLIKNHFKKVKYVRQLGHGLPNARNQALKIVGGDLVVFFDDDCDIHENWIKEIKNVFIKYDDVGGVCGRIKKMYGDKIKYGLLGKIMYHYAKIFGISGVFVTLNGIGRVLPTGFTTINFDKATKDTEVQWISGCDMCFSRAAIKLVGNFYEGFVGNGYYEDVEFSYRVHESGLKLYVCSNAHVDHKVSPVSRETLSKLKYNQIVNQKKFFYRTVYKSRLTQYLMFKLAHLALFFPIFGYSIYSRSFALLTSYFKAEMNLKY